MLACKPLIFSTDKKPLEWHAFVGEAAHGAMLSPPSQTGADRIGLSTVAGRNLISRCRLQHEYYQ
jgi:hypothetical protein